MKTIIAYILARRTPDKAFLLGIDGLGGAGKSTISEKIREDLTAQSIPVILLHEDDFIHPKAVRYNDSIPAWQCYYNLQWRFDDLRKAIAQFRKADGNKFEIKLYDKDNDCYLCQQATSISGAVVIVEGIFLQRKELAGLFDCMIYVDVPKPVRLERVLRRDSYIGDSKAIRKKYELRYFPAEHHYLDECDPAAHADFIIR